MKITNVVYGAHLDCTVDLNALCQCLWNCRYDPKLFPGLIWQHRVIGGNCLIFANGVINCNVRASSFEEGRQRLHGYVQQFQNLGCQVRLKDVKSITASASHTLSGALDLYRLARDRTLLGEHKLFPAVNFKIKGIDFCCFHTGKVVITGIRRRSQIDGVVYPALIELELYVRTSM